MKISQFTKSSIFLSMFFIAFIGSVPVAESGKNKNKKIVARLEKGSPVRVRGNGVEVGKLAHSLRKHLGVELKCVDDSGRPDRLMLQQTIAIPARSPFWGAIRAVQKETGLLLKRVESGKIQLATKVFGGRNRKPAGQPVVVGSFLVMPSVDSFWKRLEIALCPEPWAAGTEVTWWRAVAALEGGETAHCESSKGEVQRAGSLNMPGNRGVINLQFDEKFGGEARKAKRLELEMDVRVPMGMKRFVSPVISSLLPRKTEFGSLGSVWVIELGVRKTEKGKRVVARLRSDGNPLTEDAVRLVTRDGTRHAPVSWSRGQNAELFEFDSLDVGSKMSKLDLEVRLAEFKEINLGVLGAIKGKTKKAALSKVKVVGATVRDSEIKVELEVTGKQIFVDGTALMSGGQWIDGDGHRFSKRDGTWHGSVTFPSSDVKDFESWSLIVKAPRRYETVLIKKPEKLAPKLFTAGAASVRVVGIETGSRPIGFGKGEDAWNRMTLEISGTTIDSNTINLLDFPKNSVQKGFGGSPGSGSKEFELGFSPDELGKGGLKRCRFEIQAPQRAITHRLKATLRDIKLKL